MTGGEHAPRRSRETHGATVLEALAPHRLRQRGHVLRRRTESTSFDWVGLEWRRARVAPPWAGVILRRRWSPPLATARRVRTCERGRGRAPGAHGGHAPCWTGDRRRLARAGAGLPCAGKRGRAGSAAAVSNRPLVEGGDALCARREGPWERTRDGAPERAASRVWLRAGPGGADPNHARGRRCVAAEGRRVGRVDGCHHRPACPAPAAPASRTRSVVTGSMEFAPCPLRSRPACLQWAPASPPSSAPT